MNLALGGSGEALKFQMRLEEAKLVTQRQDVIPLAYLFGGCEVFNCKQGKRLSKTLGGLSLAQAYQGLAQASKVLAQASKSLTEASHGLAQTSKAWSKPPKPG